jgi:hypothetical protein
VSSGELNNSPRVAIATGARQKVQGMWKMESESLLREI